MAQNRWALRAIPDCVIRRRASSALRARMGHRSDGRFHLVCLGRLGMLMLRGAGDREQLIGG